MNRHQGSIPVSVQGLEPDLAVLLVPRLGPAVTDLDLQEDLGALEVCADDLPGQDTAWFRWERPRGSAKPALTVFCHPEAFLKRRHATSTVFPPRPVWEQREAPAGGEVTSPADFSPERTDQFLHHHLLTARDLIRGLVVPADIPPRWSAAFAAAWAVGVDGRLERLGLPGYSLIERRGSFSRLFSSAGVLMPDHWQVFQSLWDGALAVQGDVLGAVQVLPRL